MIKLALRFIAFILLILIVVMDDFPFYEKMKDSTTQLFLATIVVIFIFYDIVFGFIMGIILLLIYYEIYKKIIMKHENTALKENMKPELQSVIANDNYMFYKEYDDVPSQLNYISDEHLLAAQNNVFDIDNYKTEIRGIEHGFNDEKVYGVQGLDSQHVNYIGFNKDDIYADF